MLITKCGSKRQGMLAAGAAVLLVIASSIAQATLQSCSTSKLLHELDSPQQEGMVSLNLGCKGSCPEFKQCIIQSLWPGAVGGGSECHKQEGVADDRHPYGAAKDWGGLPDADAGKPVRRAAIGFQ